MTAVAADSVGEADRLANGMKEALRRFARSVAVISVAANGGRIAMAATAVSEVSLTPPAMLVCINQSAAIHAALAPGAPFGINLLQAAQAEVAGACGGKLKGENRFTVGDWRTADEGVPVLKDAQASFVCRVVDSMVFGTHSIFVGRVEKVTVGTDIEPLLYVDGRYARVEVVQLS